MLLCLTAPSASVASLLTKFLLSLLAFFLTSLFALLKASTSVCFCAPALLLVFGFFELFSFSYFHKCLRRDSFLVFSFLAPIGVSNADVIACLIWYQYHSHFRVL